MILTIIGAILILVGLWLAVDVLRAMRRDRGKSDTYRTNQGRDMPPRSPSRKKKTW